MEIGTRHGTKENATPFQQPNIPPAPYLRSEQFHIITPQLIIPLHGKACWGKDIGKLFAL
jgi:hypothetical protein